MSPTTQSGVVVVGRRLLPFPGQDGDTIIAVDGVPHAVTAADGSFVLIGLQPGTRTFSAHRESTLVSEGTFDVLAGQVTRLPDTLLVVGDAWLDQRIDILDTLLVMAAFGRCASGPSYQSHLDIDGDGCIAADDLDLIGGNLGHLGPTNWSTDP